MDEEVFHRFGKFGGGVCCRKLTEDGSEYLNGGWVNSVDCWKEI